MKLWQEQSLLLIDQIWRTNLDHPWCSCRSFAVKPMIGSKKTLGFVWSFCCHAFCLLGPTDHLASRKSFENLSNLKKEMLQAPKARCCFWGQQCFWASSLTSSISDIVFGGIGLFLLRGLFFDGFSFPDSQLLAPSQGGNNLIRRVKKRCWEL